MAKKAKRSMALDIYTCTRLRLIASQIHRREDLFPSLGSQGGKLLSTSTSINAFNADGRRIASSTRSSGRGTTRSQIGPGRRRTTCKTRCQFIIIIELTLHREGAPEVIQTYFEKIGGRPKPKKGRKRQHSEANSATATPEAKGSGRRKRGKVDDEEGTPAEIVKAKASRNWHPPHGSWEKELMTVETLEEHNDPKTGERKLRAYVCFNNGEKSQFDLRTLRQKCPQKVSGICILPEQKHLLTAYSYWTTMNSICG